MTSPRLGSSPDRKETRRSPCALSCARPASCTRTATFPAGSTTPSRRASRPSPATRSLGLYEASDDALFKARCIHVKQGRAELVKHHLDVLWHDPPSRAPRGVPGPARQLLEGDEAGKQGQAVARPCRRQGVAVDDRHHRRDVEGDWRPGEDARQRAAFLSVPDRCSQGGRDCLPRCGSSFFRTASL